MRIQEMRSGLTHLRRGVADEPEKNGSKTQLAHEDVLTLGIRKDEPLPPIYRSELEEPVWSVVCFDGIEAGGMTYAQAARLMAELATHGVPGLCIVTDTAASREIG